MQTISGIQEAVNKYGGSPSKLAAAVGGDVKRQHVEHWLKSGVVSAPNCPLVELATGVPCERLNPDVRWDVVRKGRNAGRKQAA